MALWRGFFRDLQKSIMTQLVWREQTHFPFFQSTCKGEEQHVGWEEEEEEGLGGLCEEVPDHNYSSSSLRADLKLIKGFWRLLNKNAVLTQYNGLFWSDAQLPQHPCVWLKENDFALKQPVLNNPPAPSNRNFRFRAIEDDSSVENSKERCVKFPSLQSISAWNAREQRARLDSAQLILPHGVKQ